MSNFITISSAFAVLACIFVYGDTSNASIKLNLHTGLQLGAETAVLFSPASIYLRTVNRTVLVSKIRIVHRVLESLTTLMKYQQQLNYSAGDSHQLIALGTIMQAVVDDSCHWLNSFLNGTFTCTEAGVISLMASAKTYQAMLESANRFRRVCNCSETDYMQWILENIPCEGEGIIARDYMSSPDSGFHGLRGDLSLLRCTVHRCEC